MDRAQQMIRVVFFATMLATVLDAIDMDSRLPLTCKNIARDVIINSCKGSRIKRSTQKPDLEDIEEDTKIDAPEVPEDEPRATLQKRQWGMMPGMTSGFGMPEYGMSGIGTEMGSEMDSNSHTTELKLPGVDFHDNRESEMVNEQYGSSGFMPMPYQPMGMGPFYRTSDSSDKLLGYELSADELEELYKEIGERMPRNSKDLNKKIFLNVAEKCCMNAKLCLENPSLIPCMGY